MDSMDSQQERLLRMIELWEDTLKNKDLLIAGDMNIDWNKINNNDYHLKPLASRLMDYILEENLTQMNEQYTREEQYRDEIRQSNIDHFYTNTP